MTPVETKRSLEDDHIVPGIRPVNLAALVWPTIAVNMQKGAAIEIQREAKWLNAERSDDVLNEFTEVEGPDIAAFAPLVQVGLAVFIDVLEPPLQSDLATVRKSKLDRPWVNGDLPNLLADQKSQGICGQERVHGARSL